MQCLSNAIRCVTALLTLFGAALSLRANAVEPIHGRVQLQYVHAEQDSNSVAAALGEQTVDDGLADLRLTWSPRWDQWNADVAYRVDFDAGGSPILQRREVAVGLIRTPQTNTWWDWEHQITDKPHLTGSHAIDRLTIGYNSDHWVLRAGRQALTWGSGMVFHPLDLFDPFAPDGTDVEYKPGTDMLYGQYLFDNGTDVQAVIVPRRLQGERAPSAETSSFALHLHTTIQRLQMTWLLARDHGDVTLGIGVNGSIGGATWNAEAIPVRTHNDRTYVSGLLNISDAQQWWHHDATIYAEYFHNGFGMQGAHYSLDQLPYPLIDRLARGQVFNTGRDYLAAGMQLQLTALAQFSPTAIYNVNDRSGYVIAQLSYSLGNNQTLIVGGEVTVGSSGTEFGGIALTANSAPYFEIPTRAYLQLRSYF